MGRPQKAKRKGWQRPPAKKKKRPTCKVCRRKFTPKKDNPEPGTCRLCQLGLTEDAKLLKAEAEVKALPEPEKPQESTIQSEKPKRKKKTKRLCLGGCGKEILSEGFHNCICKNCRTRNANVSPFAEPIGTGRID